MNLIRIFAALLAVVVLVGCEQPASTDEGAAAAAGEEPMAEEPMAEEPMAEEPMAEEPMEAVELEQATEGEAEEAAAEDGDGSGETADDAMDASEMPADADDTMPAMELEEAEAAGG